MTSSEDWWTRTRRVLDAASEVEFERGYDRWAPDYDADHESFGGLLLVHFVGMFCRHVPVTAQPILDAGCGTGRLAEALRLQGYGHFVGIDLSAGMLKVAREKALYDDLHRARLGEPLDMPSEQFEAVGSLAAMSPKHIGADAFDELIRITRPGGTLVLSLRAGTEHMTAFNQRRVELVKAGRWTLIDETPTFVSHPEFDPPISYGVHVYRRTS